MPSTDLLSSIGICTAAAALLAVVSHRLKLPLILAYILTGVVIGPTVLNLVHDHTSIETVSEIGLILLLFVIGLEIDLKKLAKAGLPAVVTGALQVPICFALGLGFFYLTGIRDEKGNLALLYLAACASLSSTLIVVKILYDKFELDTLPGRITLCVLVIQDVWAVAMLAVQPNIEHPDPLPLLLSLGKGAVLVGGALFMSRFVLRYLFRSVAKVPELVLVSALAWCFFLAALASLVGLSREMGALIAGVSLSTYPYARDVGAKAISIRDFFVTLFFVGLGLQVPVPTPSTIGLAVLVAAFVIVSRIAVVPILYALRMGHRTSLLPAINLTQMGEFAIVLASLGRVRGQLSTETVSVLTLAFALTAIAATFIVSGNHAIQAALSRVLRLLRIPDIDAHRHREAAGAEHAADIVVLGFFRDASSLLVELQTHWGPRKTSLHERLLVVDFNPTVIEELRRRGFRCMYGDISHPETLQHAGLDKATVVLSTITDDVLRGTDNLRILRTVRSLNPEARVVLTTEHITEALDFYAQGADFVFIPRLHSATELAESVLAGLNRGFAHRREHELERLGRRDEVLV